MNKFLVIFFVSVLAVLGFVSCSSGTYADKLDDEKKLIADFIKRQNIKVVSEFPADNEWGDKVYVRTKSGLYYHLVDPGDNTNLSDTISDNDQVIVRYITYTLDQKADTSYYYSTLDAPTPYTFYYDKEYTSSSGACVGWQEAVKHMKYNNSSAKIIVPSKLSFDTYLQDVTPMGYDMKIKILKAY